MTQAWLLLNNGHCCNFKCNYGDWKKEENNSTVCSVYGMVEVISVMFVWLVQCSSIAMVLHTRLCMASITTMACQRAGASKSNYVYIITVHWEPMAYNTCPHWHTGTHTGTHTHTHNTLTHRQTHWHTHTLIHRQTDTLTHTHTHTHTSINSRIGGMGAMVVTLVGVVDEGLELLGPGALVDGTWLPLHFSY